MLTAMSFRHFDTVVWRIKINLNLVTTTSVPKEIFLNEFVCVCVCAVRLKAPKQVVNSSQLLFLLKEEHVHSHRTQKRKKENKKC